MCAYSVKGEQCINKSDNMIGCTWLDGRGLLLSEAIMHTSCYIYFTSIYTVDVSSTSTKPNVHEAYPEKN